MSVNEFNKNNRKTAKYNIVEHQQCRANYMNTLDRDAETNASSMQDHTSGSSHCIRLVTWSLLCIAPSRVLMVLARSMFLKVTLKLLIDRFIDSKLTDEPLHYL